MVYIPVGQQVTATMGTGVVKRVTCEKCSCAYVYEMVRSATGSGLNPYFIDPGGAEDRAYGRAARRLRKALVEGAEPVACPDCGWYQGDMVREIKRRRVQPVVYLGW